MKSTKIVSRARGMGWLLAAAVVFSMGACSGSSSENSVPGYSSALWAKAATAGTGSARFVSVTTDSDGNVYAAGYIEGTETVTFAKGISVTGLAQYYTACIVKYNSSGTALWAKAFTTAPGDSQFNGIKAATINGTTSIYAAGFIAGTGTFTLGSVTVTGVTSNYNPVIACLAADGTVSWAKSTTAASSSCEFEAVTVDSLGNVYAGGYLWGPSTFTFASGVTASSGCTANRPNALLVKYSSTGTVLWAKTVSSGVSDSEFDTIAVDSEDNIYAAGCIDGAGTYTYATGVTATGGCSDVYNMVVVKYNSSGTALWAATPSTATNTSYLYGLALDSSNNVLVCGYIYSTGSYDFGNGITATGTRDGSTDILLKYNSSGTAQWCQAVSGGNASYSGIATDSQDNIYIAATGGGTDTCSYGNGVTSVGNHNWSEPLVVKFDSTGAAQWAQNAQKAPDFSDFSGIAVDASDNIYCAGFIGGNGTYSFGNSVTAAGVGATQESSILVKYASE